MKGPVSYKDGGTGHNELPSGRTMLDDDISEDPGQGEGANDERFSDPIDQMPKEKPEPVGPHNMQRGGIFDQVARRTKIRSINRI